MKAYNLNSRVFAGQMMTDSIKDHNALHKRYLCFIISELCHSGSSFPEDFDYFQISSQWAINKSLIKSNDGELLSQGIFTTIREMKTSVQP